MFFFAEIMWKTWQLSVQFTSGFTAYWFKFWGMSMNFSVPKSPDIYWKQIHEIWKNDRSMDTKTAETQKIIDAVCNLPLAESIKEQFKEFLSLAIMDAVWQPDWESANKTCGMAYGVLSDSAKNHIRIIMADMDMEKAWKSAWASCETTTKRSYGVE